MQVFKCSGVQVFEENIDVRMLMDESHNVLERFQTPSSPFNTFCIPTRTFEHPRPSLKIF